MHSYTHTLPHYCSYTAHTMQNETSVNGFLRRRSTMARTPRAHTLNQISIVYKLKQFVLQLILVFHITHGRQIIIIGKLHTHVHRSVQPFLLCQLFVRNIYFIFCLPFRRCNRSVQLCTCVCCVCVCAVIHRRHREKHTSKLNDKVFGMLRIFFCFFLR